MKKIIKYKIDKDKQVEKKVTYIPLRYIIAVTITVFEVALILATVAGLLYHVPYFYIATILTQIGCVIKIIASDYNPDYKIPWLFFVITLPIVGFMLYFLFYSRRLKRKYVKRLDQLKEYSFNYDDVKNFDGLSSEDELVASTAQMLCKISSSRLFTNTTTEYFATGEKAFYRMLDDLEKAEAFIYLEYFIIEEGKMWGDILNILRKKVEAGVDVKVVYDDIGCMTKLSGWYFKKLRGYGIDATPFSVLKGQADSEFNNRNHRKLLIIDGKVGYTGGINIADEYINEVRPFGYWKDGGIRLEGNAVWGMTELFLIDYGLNVRRLPEIKYDVYPKSDIKANGYVIPFGDGPKPLYTRNVGKCAIMNMLGLAKKYAYITTPYLIIDNELCGCIENTALRGVDVRIVLPHIPDKKTVFDVSRSFYNRLISAGVKIYEYEPGFIHSKIYLVDGEVAMIGTINLDYRSLVHHFENGVWLYRADAISDVKKDLENTINRSIRIRLEDIKPNLFKRLKTSIVRIFAPLL